MFNFSIDMNSEAMRVLNRLSNINAYKIHRQNRLKQIAIDAARRSYRKSWGGIKERPVNNVYRAVKKALLGHNKRGVLTGSTWRYGIQAYADEKGIKAGFVPQSMTWPSTTGSAKQPLSAVARFLKEVWGKNHQSRMGRGEQYLGTTRLHTATEKSAMLRGDVTMEWGASGLKIRWPEDAKQIFKLRDMDIPSEPYTSKRYYQDRQEKFFFLDQHDIQDSMNVVDDYMDNLISGRMKEPVSRPSAPEPAIQEKGIREVYEEQAVQRVGYEEFGGKEPIGEITSRLPGGEVSGLTEMVDTAYTELTQEAIQWLKDHGMNPKSFKGYKG